MVHAFYSNRPYLFLYIYQYLTLSFLIINGLLDYGYIENGLNIPIGMTGLYMVYLWSYGLADAVKC